MAERDIAPLGLLVDVSLEQVSRLYKRSLAGEPIPPDTPGLRDLVALRVLVPDPTEADRYTTFQPAQVRAAIRNLALAQLAETTQMLTRLSSLHDEMGVAYNELRPSASSGEIEHLEGDEIHPRILELVNGAQSEVLTAQPGGPRAPEVLARSLERDREALQRGVSMRTLYHATARSGPETQDWARDMAALGGEIRTLNAPFVRTIIVDRAHAFLQDLLERNDGMPENYRAHLVHDRAVCAYLASVFERDWARADYWHGSSDGSDGLLTTSIQRAILRRLSAGRSQEQAARDLGMSVRTLQKHLAGLRAKFPHLTTIAAMTYWWATCPERTMD